MLSDMIEGGRLTEADIPDDYEAVVHQLEELTGAEKSGGIAPGDALPILKMMEATRLRMEKRLESLRGQEEAYPTTASRRDAFRETLVDYACRVMESFVAESAGFKNRMEWSGPSEGEVKDRREA
jgi:hypothetical protein